MTELLQPEVGAMTPELLDEPTGRIAIDTRDPNGSWGAMTAHAFKPETLITLGYDTYSGEVLQPVEMTVEELFRAARIAATLRSIGEKATNERTTDAMRAEARRWLNEGPPVTTTDDRRSS